MNRTMSLAIATIAIGVMVFGLKYAAYAVTGSVALYSDALESIVNLAASVTAFAALTVSHKPADRTHPYGHHKVEYFSAVFEGVLIVVAALLIVREAYVRFAAPVPLEAPLLGIAISAGATALNAAWCWMLIREGRRLRSPVLMADGQHLRADVVTSAGTAVGVALTAISGWLILDPLVATLVAANIVRSGWHVMRESAGGLMDAAAPPEEEARIRALIAQHAEGAIEAHDLRTRRAGPATFVDLHLVVPGNMSVSRAHEICDRIEQALEVELGKGLITIHVEPENKAKHAGILVARRPPREP